MLFRSNVLVNQSKSASKSIYRPGIAFHFLVSTSHYGPWSFFISTSLRSLVFLYFHLTTVPGLSLFPSPYGPWSLSPPLTTVPGLSLHFSLWSLVSLYFHLTVRPCTPPSNDQKTNAHVIKQLNTCSFQTHKHTLTQPGFSV